ncbi:MAG: hypothetical protein V2A79_18650 [Planctomycetota bacterium]
MPAGRRALATAGDLLKSCLPGSVRLTLHLYDAHARQYRPLPRRHVRVAVDTPAQAETLWAAVVVAVTVEVDTWPKLGDGVDAGFAIETVQLEVEEGEDGEK